MNDNYWLLVIISVDLYFQLIKHIFLISTCNEVAILDWIAIIADLIFTLEVQYLGSSYTIAEKPLICSGACC
jgi:hypothetical protein